MFSECRTFIDTDVETKELETKSRILDSIPTRIHKQCADMFLPVITQTINLSLSAGVMTDNLKQAILILIYLLKKSPSGP